MSIENIVTRMKANEIVDIVKNGKTGTVYFDRTPTNLYAYYDMRLTILGNVPLVFDGKDLKEVTRILEFQEVKLP